MSDVFELVAETEKESTAADTQEFDVFLENIIHHLYDGCEDFVMIMKLWLQ